MVVRGCRKNNQPAMQISAMPAPDQIAYATHGYSSQDLRQSPKTAAQDHECKETVHRRANPSDLVSSEVALTSATMQKASIAQAPMNCCPQLAASSRDAFG
jgi:hypothetical protein